MSNTPERDLVKEARELLGKATPGPWTLTGNLPDYAYGVLLPIKQTAGDLHYAVAWGITEYVPGAGFMDQYSEPVQGQSSNNMKLIARAPELLASLCDEVERLREHVKDLNCDLEASEKHCEEYHS